MIGGIVTRMTFIEGANFTKSDLQKDPLQDYTMI